jgi:hypothetical protein
MRCRTPVMGACLKDLDLIADFDVDFIITTSTVAKSRVLNHTMYAHIAESDRVDLLILDHAMLYQRRTWLGFPSLSTGWRILV